MKYYLVFLLSLNSSKLLGVYVMSLLSVTTDQSFILGTLFVHLLATLCIKIVYTFVFKFQKDLCIKICLFLWILSCFKLNSFPTFIFFLFIIFFLYFFPYFREHLFSLSLITTYSGFFIQHKFECTWSSLFPSQFSFYNLWFLYPWADSYLLYYWSCSYLLGWKYSLPYYYI